MTAVPLPTGVGEEVTKEVTWKIRNFDSVQQYAYWLDLKNLELDVNGSLGHRGHRSKWLIGWRNDLIYIRLIECSKTSGLILFNAGIEYAQYDHQWTNKNTWTVDTQPISKDEEITISTGWPLFRHPSEWRHNCDHDGSIYLKIKLVVLVPGPDPSTTAYQTFAEEATNQLKASMEGLLMQAESTDVKIICSDNVILEAHKILLSARNPVFALMLSSGMAEDNTGIINVEDVSSDTMKIILHFLYTGNLLPAWCNPENIVEFTYAAGKYQLDEVLKLLDSVLGTESVPTANMLLLSLANKLNLKNAETKLVHRIQSMSAGAKDAKELLELFPLGN